MGEFYRVKTYHGTWLAADRQSGVIVCGADDSLEPVRHAVLAYVSGARPNACFLFSDPSGSPSLELRPGLRCEVLVPLGLVPRVDAPTVSFYHPDSSKWLCAAPVPNGADFGNVVADRDKIRAYERFTLVPVERLFVPPATLMLAQRLDAILSTPLCAEVLSMMMPEDASLVQAVGRLMSLIQLGELARALLASPEARQKLRELFPNDLLGNLGLPSLAVFLKAREESALPPKPKGLQEPPLVLEPSAIVTPAARETGSITLGTELDRLAKLGFAGEYVSFPHACTVMARRSVEPRRDVCIIATARNEGLYLLEWIAYHRAIGIEAFFLYSNDNDDGSDELLAVLARGGAIHWADSRVATGGSAQRKAYGHALGICSEVLDYRWALIIDLDEYMVLNPEVFRSIPAYLRWQEAEPVDAIALNWIFHSSCGEARWRDNFIVRRFPSPVEGLNQHIKTICRPRLFIHSQAHHPVTYRHQQFVFKNSSGGPHIAHEKHGLSLSDTPQGDYAWINHYFYKSTEEYLLKWSRNRGDYATVRQPTNAVLTANFVRSFMKQFQDNGTARADPEAAASGFAAELARLMSLRGVADAFERVKQIYHARMKEIIPMFLDAPGILEAGSVGKAFLDTLRVPRQPESYVWKSAWKGNQIL